MDFRIIGLPAAPFAKFFGLPDDALLALGARRQISPGSYPCRIGMEEIPQGEAGLLLNYRHHDAAASPYRAAGPIFVREGATETFDRVNEVPPVMRSRLLSLRAYDADGMMVDAGVVAGAEAEGLIVRLLARPDTAWVHAHNAMRGCYSGRVVRA